MTVADLIVILQQLDPAMQVMVEDHICRSNLHPDDVQVIDTPGN